MPAADLELEQLRDRARRAGVPDAEIATVGELEFALESREAELARLLELGPLAYDLQRRDAAERLGVSVSALDDEMHQRRQRSDATKERSAIEALFPAIEPCDGIVDGRELVLAIRDEIRRYVVLSEHEALAAALWALHTHAVDAAFIAPILAIRSPQKRCGKSTLLDVLRSLVRRGLLVNSVSTAVVYRAMDMYRPTLLIDEADSFLDENEELRGIINGGHSRATAKTLRIGGANRDKVEVFDGFGPKAIAGIGKRKDTISDRAIQITMRRRRPDEAVEPLRQDRLDNRQLQSLAAAWTAASMAELQCADPAIPESLHDRAADNWRPLLAIADLCRLGDEARRAAVALTGTDDGAAGVIMLEDIRRLFVDQKLDRMSSAFTVEQLAELEDRPWPEWKQGKPITPRQLARLLEQFEIAPKLLKIAGATVRGYRLEQFADAFARYLGDSALPSVTPLPANNCAESGASDSVTDRATVTDRSVTATEPVADHKTLKASNDAAGNGVTDRNGAGTAWSEP